MLSKEEQERFDQVINTILLPLVQTNKEDIDQILSQDEDLRTKVEEKLQLILQRRPTRANLSGNEDEKG